MTDQLVQYKAESKFTGTMNDPTSLTIVGLDCPDSDYPELADPFRINLPLDEETIASMMDVGVVKPVKVRTVRGDDRVFVVEGRQRVRHAREANKRLRATKRDESKILVPCVPEKGDVLSALIIGNEHATEDTLEAKAEKASRMRARGDSDERIARFFRVQVQTVKTWFSFAGAPAEAKQAAKNGEIAPHVVAEIGKAAPAKQKAALAVARAAGGKGAKAVDAVRQVAKGKDPVVHANNRMTMGQMRKFQDLLAPTEEEPFTKKDGNIELAYHLMSCILGESPTALKDFPEVQKEFRKALKRGKAES